MPFIVGRCKNDGEIYLAARLLQFLDDCLAARSQLVEDERVEAKAPAGASNGAPIAVAIFCSSAAFNAALPSHQIVPLVAAQLTLLPPRLGGSRNRARRIIPRGSEIWCTLFCIKLT